jgi:hypothetical protein
MEIRRREKILALEEIAIIVEGFVDHTDQENRVSDTSRSYRRKGKRTLGFLGISVNESLQPGEKHPLPLGERDYDVSLRIETTIVSMKCKNNARNKDGHRIQVALKSRHSKAIRKSLPSRARK